MEFLWVTRELGSQWESWRVYAAQWLATQYVGIGNRLRAIKGFFEDYLHKLDLPPDPSWLLRRSINAPDYFETACPRSIHGMKQNNCIREFLNWVLENHFSGPDDHGRPAMLPNYHNPVPWKSMNGLVRAYESVHSPLPYHFIRELSDILASGEHFRDWQWAQDTIAGRNPERGTAGDWFKVTDEDLVRDDPDCVWRRRRLRRREVLEMWCPARSVALLVKLTLPLRTYQVRMLDSGEADTWLYTSNGWTRNRGALASGDERRPVQRGVFRRIEDRESGSILNGIYINTNKTADIHSEDSQLGYVIPWQHDRLLYWLEKLRNWQKKVQLHKQKDSMDGA
jgi:hypothetical protein